MAGTSLGDRGRRDRQRGRTRHQEEEPGQGAAAGRARASSSGSTSGTSSATRAANREVQTALNYFGFPVGTPDGVLGRNSRAGIADFQTYMGYPVTGQLTAYQQDFLVGSYSRALAGGASTDQAIAANPQGAKGLLSQWSTVAVAPAASADDRRAGAVLRGAVGRRSMPLSGYCAPGRGGDAGVVAASARCERGPVGGFLQRRGQRRSATARR